MANEIAIVLSALNKTNKPFKEVEGNIKSLENSSRGLIDRGLSPLQNLLGVGLKASIGLAIGAIGGLTAAFGASVAGATSMQQQVADIASLLGMTSAEAAPLKDLIKDLNLDPDLKVNATEAGDAIAMLARNGLSMEQIMDGAARSVVLMSNATGADFGMSADIATDAMALFNITAEEMSKAVNGVSSVLTNSKFTANDYRLGLAQAGGMVKTIGLDFDSFNEN